MTATDLGRLVREIQDVGFLDPLIVVPILDAQGIYYRILGGEHRYKAAMTLGLPGVPCVVLEDPKFQDEELQKAMTARLIFLKGKVDRTKLVHLVKEFADKYSAEKTRDLFAFTDQTAWNQIVWGLKKQIQKAGLPAEAVKEFDERARGKTAMKDLTAIVEYLFTTYKGTLSHGYMVFTFSGRQYVYIPATGPTVAAAEKLMNACAEHSIDINLVLQEALRAALASITPTPAATDVAPAAQDRTVQTS